MISTLNTTWFSVVILLTANMENCKDLKGSSVSSTTSMPPAMPAPNPGRRSWDTLAWICTINETRLQCQINKQKIEETTCRVCNHKNSKKYEMQASSGFFSVCGQSYKSRKILCRTIGAETQQTVLGTLMLMTHDFDILSPGSSLISMLQSRKQRIELLTRTTPWFVLFHTWHQQQLRGVIKFGPSNFQSKMSKQKLLSHSESKQKKRSIHFTTGSHVPIPDAKVEGMLQR